MFGEATNLLVIAIVDDFDGFLLAILPPAFKGPNAQKQQCGR